MTDRGTYYDQPCLWDRSLTSTEEERARLVRAAWPRGVRTVLDVGCGNGAIADCLPENALVTGIDLSAEALRHFRHRGILASAAQCPFRERSFDIVVCADTLEHLRPGEFEACLRELRRVAARFILVISPNGEDLEANSTKCRRCGTIFHMNWHVRSLDQAELEAPFREGWRLQCVSFFGEKWVRQDRSVGRLERALSDRFPYWEHAVCPVCGSRQGDLGEHSHTGARENAVVAFGEILPSVGRSARDERCEVLLLFERVDPDGEPDAEEEREREAALLVRAPLGDPMTAHVVVRPRGSVDMESPLCVSAVTHIGPDRGYVVVNELTDWGEPYLVDGRWVRNYEDRGGKDGHALFVLPWDVPARTRLLISYKDTSRESVRVQLYDPQRGYLDVGTLPGEATGEWRDATFLLPLGVGPGAEGLIGHLVVDGMTHPRSAHPVARIGYVGGGAQILPLSLRPASGEGEGVWIGDYVGGPDDPWSEQVIQLSRSAIVSLRLPRGEWYLLGEGAELAVPGWLSESFRSNPVRLLEAEVAGLRQQLAEAEETRVRESAGLRQQLAEAEETRVRESAELRQQLANLERVKAGIEATMLEMATQLARANDLGERIGREFQAYRASIGIREIDHLKKMIGRLVHAVPKHRPRVD